MKTHHAPNGEYITIPDGRVITFGLSEEQNNLVKNSLPTKGCELFDTDAPTDLIALSAFALIVIADALDVASRVMISDYYTGIGGCTNESVFWLGYPKPPFHLRAKFNCYQSFEELAVNLKYHLSSAYNKSKKLMILTNN